MLISVINRLSVVCFLSFQMTSYGLYALFYHRLFGYGMGACVIEISSMFLHGRMLLLMYGVSKSSFLFMLNNLFNIFTYLTCRIGSLVLLLYLTIDDCQRLPLFWCYWLRGSMSIVLIMSFVMLYRLIRSDFMTKRSRDGADTDIMMANNNMNGYTKTH